MKLREFIQQHEGLLLTMAEQLTGNAVDAQDVVAETWLKMLRFAGSYDDSKASLKTWAVTIMRNTWFSELHKREHRQHWNRVSTEAPAEDEMMLLEVLADSAPTPVMEFERAFVKAALLKAIEQLTPGQRAAVEARLENETHKEAVIALGGGRGCKTQMGNGYARLRPILTQMEICA